MTGLSLAHERVPDLCRELGLSAEAREQAVDVAKRVDYEYAINRSPDVVAAGCVYFVALLQNEKRTQADVAAAADVSRVAIRQAYIEIGEAEGYPMRRDDDSEADESPDRLTRRLRNKLPWRAEP